jgi:catalase
MNGYGSHTYMWLNAGGEKFWVKYHFHTEQGMEFFTNAEAATLTGEVLERALEYWRRVDADLGARIEKAVRQGNASNLVAGSGEA